VGSLIVAAATALFAVIVFRTARLSIAVTF
jgi:hypothetical protein